MARCTKQNYGGAVKRGITFSKSRTRPAPAKRHHVEVDLQRGAQSRQTLPGAQIAALISSGELIQAAPLAIWSAAVDCRKSDHPVVARNRQTRPSSQSPAASTKERR
jgi:hypothetical protein